MRLHPIVGGVFRRALRDFDLGGFHIPKVVRRITNPTSLRNMTYTILLGLCDS